MAETRRCHADASHNIGRLPLWIDKLPLFVGIRNHNRLRACNTCRRCTGKCKPYMCYPQEPPMLLSYPMILLKKGVADM
eukprot:scaffold12505_cov43-Tisochrysis_lutea.AAC.1